MNPASIDRLKSLREQLAGMAEDMETKRGRFAALKTRHEDGTAPRAVTSFNLFQTPEAVARRMAETACALVPDAGRILEPSAGLGRIYRAIKTEAPDARIVMIEEERDCCRELSRDMAGRDGDRLHEGDFLTMDPGDIGGTFDAVIMNPPFKQGRDIKHILHARRFLRRGGVIVSLCYDGARQNAFLKPLADSWEVLPGGTFKEEGTGAGVAMLTMRNNEKIGE